MQSTALTDLTAAVSFDLVVNGATLESLGGTVISWKAFAAQFRRAAVCRGPHKLTLACTHHRAGGTSLVPLALTGDSWTLEVPAGTFNNGGSFLVEATVVVPGVGTCCVPALVLSSAPACCCGLILRAVNPRRYITANIPPTQGTVACSPTFGEEMSTVFELRAAGFTDPDSTEPLTYMFFTWDLATGARVA